MERARGRRGGRRGAGEGWRRVKDCLRQFVAFMFSNVGIVGLVVGYAIAGAFIFMAIEGGTGGGGAAEGAIAVTKARRRVVQRLWDATSALNVFSEAEWRAVAAAEVAALQKAVVDAALEKGLETSPPPGRTGLLEEGGTGGGEGDGGKEGDEAKQTVVSAGQWSFSGAFLYSLTVITTIGYGNVSPQTEWGKLATIFYAIAGMPLFLLYLSNIGDILAKSFKWTYAQCCLCRWCSSYSSGKKKQKHHKRKRRRKRHTRRGSHRSSSGRRGSAWGSQPEAGAWPGDESWPPEPQMEDDDSEVDSDEDSEDDSEEESGDRTDVEEEASGVRGVEAGSASTPRTTESVTVPVSLCLAIMVGYVCGGAALFDKWEGWGFLDGSYFCFISLSTIGFGDIVPGDRITSGNGVELSFIFCSAYLMLGMALIAMCFSLMQEEVVHKMRGLVRAVKATARCVCGSGRRGAAAAEADIALEPVNIR